MSWGLLRLKQVYVIHLCCSHQTEKEIKYEAESPDEAALVVAAKVGVSRAFTRSHCLLEAFWIQLLWKDGKAFHQIT
jgi:hypothetical protein